jgi:phage baseplate assembly protein W
VTAPVQQTVQQATPSRPAADRVPVGWPLLPLPDASGRLSFPPPDVSVRELIRVILSTRPGEQLMRPRFGAGLERFVHEPNTLATRRRIRDAVADGLARWEPRVTVDRVDVQELPDAPSAVRVEIAYRVRATGAMGAVGVSMDLEA